MNEPDPDQAASLDDLAACLRHLHLLADKPTFRSLEQDTKRKKVPLRRNAISEVLQAKTFPRKAFLLTFVEALGVDLESDQRWEQAWNRLAVQRQGSKTVVEQLSDELDQLRQSLAAEQQRSAAAEDQLAELRRQSAVAAQRASAAEDRAAAAEAAAREETGRARADAERQLAQARADASRERDELRATLEARVAVLEDDCADLRARAEQAEQRASAAEDRAAAAGTALAQAQAEASEQVATMAAERDAAIEKAHADATAAGFSQGLSGSIQDEPAGQASEDGVYVRPATSPHHNGAAPTYQANDDRPAYDEIADDDPDGYWEPYEGTTGGSPHDSPGYPAQATVESNADDQDDAWLFDDGNDDPVPPGVGFPGQPYDETGSALARSPRHLPAIPAPAAEATSGLTSTALVALIRMMQVIQRGTDPRYRD
jgi:hypothetical protein